MKIAKNVRVYFEIRKGISDLKHAGAIANVLGKHLNSRGYVQSKFVLSLWKHKRLPVSFTLVVDDFVIKFCTMKSPNHLINELKQKYEITTNMEGNFHIGFTLDWNYAKVEVNCSMIV